MARPRSYTVDQVRAAVAESASLTQTIRALGLRAAGGNFGTIRRIIEEHGISTEHFDPNWNRRGPRRAGAIPLDEVLVQGSHYNRRDLKRRLFESGFKQRQCEFCDLGELWRGRRMALILDHINGDPTDNRLRNLRILCPNCAATLDTHCARKNRIQRDPRACLLCGKQFVPRYDLQRYCSQTCGASRKGLRDPRPERRKVPRPSYEQLMTDVASMSLLAVGRKYGVSDNAIRKWIRWYERSQHPTKGIGGGSSTQAVDASGPALAA